MIHVSCKLGEFKIRYRKIETDRDVIRILFNLATSTSIAVWEGPIDFAIAKRMMDFSGSEWKIINHRDYQEERQRRESPGLVY